jgi:hypothetical protein
MSREPKSFKFTLTTRDSDFERAHLYSPSGRMGIRVKKESLSLVKPGFEDLCPFVKEELARQEKLFQNVTARRSKAAASYRLLSQDVPGHRGVALACRLLKRLVRIAFPSLRTSEIRGCISHFLVFPKYASQTKISCPDVCSISGFCSTTPDQSFLSLLTSTRLN